MIGYIFVLVATLGLPVAAMLYMTKRIRTAQPVLLGASTFIIFQILLRSPLLLVLLPKSTDYVLFQVTQPILYVFFLSLTAGIFEEIGRYVMMKRFMKDAPVADAVAFGIGHGGIEAILLVGINLIVMGASGAVAIGPTSGAFFAAGFERISALVFHVCLSVMIWRSLKEHRPLLLPVAILIHTLLNVLAGYLSFQKVSFIIIEIAIALGTILFLIYTVTNLQKNYKSDGKSDSAKRSKGDDHGTKKHQTDSF